MFHYPTYSALFHIFSAIVDAGWTELILSISKLFLELVTDLGESHLLTFLGKSHATASLMEIALADCEVDVDG